MPREEASTDARERGVARIVAPTFLDLFSSVDRRRAYCRTISIGKVIVPRDAQTCGIQTALFGSSSCGDCRRFPPRPPDRPSSDGGAALVQNLTPGADVPDAQPTMDAAMLHVVEFLL